MFHQLLAAGFTKDDFPLLTGSDCELESVKNIIAGTQSMSMFFDFRITTDYYGSLRPGVSKGLPSVKARSGSDFYFIPTFVCRAVVITKDNVGLLVEAGVYAKEELK